MVTGIDQAPRAELGSANVALMTVLNLETALYVALKFVPEGTTMTVFTRNSSGARTNVVAKVRKEPGNGWGDWQVLERPKEADASLLPETWPSEDPGIISSRTLADTFQANVELWADIDD